ncbi:MAG: nucleotidyltransferase domain-containing protein [Vulcanisaeta sp.]
MVKDFVRAMEELVSKYDELFNAFLSKLIEEFPDVTIVLFGSRARGDARRSSDFDLLIITERRLTWSDRARIYGMAGELPIDVFVISPMDLSKPLIRQMLRDGCRVIHDPRNLNPCGLASP